MSKGVELIAAERQRQIEVEGCTADHDAELSPNALAYAGACYAAGARVYVREIASRGKQLYFDVWPFDDEWYKPKDRLRDLVRAGALIAAEIDRLLAEELKKP